MSRFPLWMALAIGLIVGYALLALALEPRASPPVLLSVAAVVISLLSWRQSMSASQAQAFADFAERLARVYQQRNEVSIAKDLAEGPGDTQEAHDHWKELGKRECRLNAEWVRLLNTIAFVTLQARAFPEAWGIDLWGHDIRSSWEDTIRPQVAEFERQGSAGTYEYLRRFAARCGVT